MSRISGPALVKNSSIRSQAACTRLQSSTSGTEATCCFLNIIRIYFRDGIEVNCTTVLRGTEEGDETCCSVQKKPSELLFASAPTKKMKADLRSRTRHESGAGLAGHHIPIG